MPLAGKYIEIQDIVSAWFFLMLILTKPQNIILNVTLKIIIMGELNKCM